jgi:hypothetical protein
MNRRDQLNRNDVHPCAPTDGWPADGLASKSDSDATGGTCVEIIDRSSIDRVTP